MNAIEALNKIEQFVQDGRLEGNIDLRSIISVIRQTKDEVIKHQDPIGGGARLIALERRRQIEVEGFTAEQDDKHYNPPEPPDQLINAAIAYAMYNTQEAERAINYWPWPANFWKPARVELKNLNRKNLAEAKIRNLVKAGALLAAEIDRLQRLEKR